MRFGLLGSLEVVGDDGRSVDLGGAQARTVLAVLLAAAGRVVTADAIIDAVWGDEPPASAGGTLQSYVSRLRRGLEPGRGRGEPAQLLLWEPPGYRLAVEPDDVDFRRFEQQADEGRKLLLAGEHDAARAMLEAADALWRGPALVEYRDQAFATGLVTRLDDRRLGALDDRLAADLALGRHTAVIGELGELVAAHPLQEGFRIHLALALYRAGRQAEALRAIDNARRTLRDELGVEPSPPLRDLEAAILAHDPELEAPALPPASVPPPRVEPEPSARLVGRLAELAELRAVLDEARTATRTAIVEGEPGIGKTRLVEELAAEAADQGATVLWGRAFEGGAAPAFWPWLPPLRALADAVGLDADDTHGLGQLLSSSAEPLELSAAEPARFLLFDAVVELLASSASRAPLVLVIDDVQWADVSSLELLASVAGRLADAPLLLVATVRELDVGRNDALVETLAALTRRTGTRRLHLRGLSPADTAELVAQTTGDAVDPSLLPSIHGRAEGNPFFTTELARLLATGDPLADIPSGVRDVVRRRLNVLPDSAAELLQVAAVIGRDVDLGLLTRSSGRELDEALDDLDAAIVQRLLVPIPDQPMAYRFAHALVREVIVDGMSTLARARLHLKVADALEDTDDTAEIRAEHLWEAAPVGAGRRAADALERAARVAIRRMSYASAEDLLERAVPLRRAAGSSSEQQVAELETISLLVSVIGARSGQTALINSPLLVRGKQLARDTGRDLLHQSLLWVEWAGWDQACDMHRAEPIARELLERTETVDVLFSKCLGDTAWGICQWQRGHITEAARHLDAAAEASMAVPAGQLASSALFDRDQLRLPLPFSVYIHDLIGDLDDADQRYEEVIRHLPDDPYWELVVVNFAASSAMSTGRTDRAERAARRGVAIDPEGVSSFWSMALRCYLGASLCQQGNIDEGLPILRDAWALYSAKGLRVNGVSYLSELALAFARHDRIEEASAALRDAAVAQTNDGEHYADAILLVARAAVAIGRDDGEVEVRRLLVQARDTATEQGAHAIADRVRRDAARLGYPLT